MTLGTALIFSFQSKEQSICRDLDISSFYLESPPRLNEESNCEPSYLYVEVMLIRLFPRDMRAGSVHFCTLFTVPNNVS